MLPYFGKRKASDISCKRAHVSVIFTDVKWEYHDVLHNLSLSRMSFFFQTIVRAEGGRVLPRSFFAIIFA